MKEAIGRRYRADGDLLGAIRDRLAAHLGYLAIALVIVAVGALVRSF